MRNQVRPHLWHQLGNGKKVFVWFDKWANQCPLMDHLTTRNINRAGYNIKNKVADVVLNNTWSWPPTWPHTYPALSLVANPNLIHDRDDILFWRTSYGIDVKFSVRDAWDTLRARRGEVIWRLKTQNRLKQWDVGDAVDLNLLRCPLCKLQQDSHEHLFFECQFSYQVWLSMIRVADLPSIAPVWEDILAWILAISKSKSVLSIVGRLTIAASVYFIWQERNNRLYGKGIRHVEEVRDLIVDVVRYKLASIQFKNDPCVAQMKRVWKISNMTLSPT